MHNRQLLMTHRSPFARKVRVALHEKGLLFEEVRIDLANKPPALLRTGPVQKVPVLLDSGLNIVDSTVILEYLEERYPAVRLLPHGYLRRADARMWNETSNELAECAIEVFMASRKPGTRDYSAIEKAQQRITRILDYAEQVIGNRDYFVADQFTIADIGMVSAAGYIEFRLGKGWRQGRHALAHYVDRMSLMNSFAATPAKD